MEMIFPKVKLERVTPETHTNESDLIDEVKIALTSMCSCHYAPCAHDTIRTLASEATKQEQTDRIVKIVEHEGLRIGLKMDDILHLCVYIRGSK